MIRCMSVDEARGVCKDRRRWRSVVSAVSPPWEKDVSLCMYDYIYIIFIMTVYLIK